MYGFKRMHENAVQSILAISTSSRWIEMCLFA